MAHRSHAPGPRRAAGGRPSTGGRLPHGAGPSGAAQAAKASRPLDSSGPGDAAGLAALQRMAGNQAVAALVQRAPDVAPAVQRAPETGSIVDLAKQIHLLVSSEQQSRVLESAGRTREALALRTLDAYATLHGADGPLDDDPSFGLRMYLATLSIGRDFLKYPSFEDLPAGRKALVYAIEKLNLSPLRSGTVSPDDQAWMTTHEGTTGGKNPAVSGSTGTYGQTAWKCNKLVADSYLAKGGAGIGKENYPMYGSGKDRKWGYKASDLAATVSGGKLKLEPGKDLKRFPYSELLQLSSDGSSIAEIDEFDAKGERVARYILAGGKFEKHVPDGKGGWTKTKDTRDPSELQPGEFAEAGDIVAFHSAEKGVSGHTGLNLGYDLFISAMNATEGVGILSVSRHIDPATWDRYDFVGYRKFK